MVEMLIDEGAAINAQDIEKDTALSCAIHQVRSFLQPRTIFSIGHKEARIYINSRQSIIYLFLEKGAEVSEQDLRNLNWMYFSDQCRRVIERICSPMTMDMILESIERF